MELVNTLSNFPAVALGLFALWLAYRRTPRAWELYALGFLLFATGVGSTLWHGTRAPLALTFDVLPGIFFLMLFVYAWSSALFGRLWGGAAIVGLFALQYLSFPVFGSLTRFSPFIPLFATLLAAGATLVALTFRTFPGAGWLSVAVMASALSAAIARLADQYTCETLSFGTHLFWHLGLGLAGFLGILLLMRMRDSNYSSEVRVIR